MRENTIKRFRQTHEKLSKSPAPGDEDGDQADFDEFGEAIKPALSGLAFDAGTQMLGQIGVDDPSEFHGALTAEAQAWADEHTGELISQLSETTRDEVRKTITDGLRDGLSRDEIADQLEELYAFSEERARVIAVTETQMANGAGSVEGLRQAKAHGLNVKKEWICDPDPCPECQANEDQGPIGVDEEFESGDDAEPAHPSCECYTNGVVIEDEDDSDDEAE